MQRTTLTAIVKRKINKRLPVWCFDKKQTGISIEIVK